MNKRRMTASLGGATVILGAALLLSPTTAAEDTEAVRAAVERAVAAEQSAMTVDPASKRLPKQTLKLSTPGSTDHLPKFTDGQVRSALARNEALLRAAFAGPQLGRELAALRQAEAQSNSRDYQLTGGAEDFRYNTLDVQDNAAHVSVVVTTWATFIHEGNGYLDVASPENDIVVDAELVKIGDEWKVEDLTWEFAPGSQP